MKPDAIHLDLRGMHPPEPMERVLDALAELLPGQTVHIVIDREPVPLYRLLERNGYQWRASPAAPGEYQIVITQGG